MQQIKLIPQEIENEIPDILEIQDFDKIIEMHLAELADKSQRAQQYPLVGRLQIRKVIMDMIEYQINECGVPSQKDLVEMILAYAIERENLKPLHQKKNPHKAITEQLLSRLKMAGVGGDDGGGFWRLEYLVPFTINRNVIPHRPYHLAEIENLKHGRAWDNYGFPGDNVPVEPVNEAEATLNTLKMLVRQLPKDQAMEVAQIALNHAVAQLPENTHPEPLPEELCSVSVENLSRLGRLMRFCFDNDPNFLERAGELEVSEEDYSYFLNSHLIEESILSPKSEINKICQLLWRCDSWGGKVPMSIAPAYYADFDDFLNSTERNLVVSN